MKTESRWWTPYVSKHKEPTKLSHQKALGTTTRLCFSVATHCTKKREKKITFPSQPIAFQKCHSMPRNLSLLQSKCVSQSIMNRSWRKGGHVGKCKGVHSSVV